MRNINKILIILALLGSFCVISAAAQITSISQLKDVKPTDKHYQALQSLVERYGVFIPYADNTFRGNDPLTREEFVVLLNASLDQLMELANSVDDDISAYQLINSFSANESNITSTSQIKDIKASYNQYIHLQSLTERYGIDICDKDKYFRPNKTVSEKEFYTWIAKIFNGSVNSDLSATKIVTRSEWVIMMEAALDSINTKIAKIIDEKKSKVQADAIKKLPSSGKAKITSYLKSYSPDNTCVNLAAASRDFQIAAQNGGIWNGYKIKDGDIGDIILETSNTCRKDEKLVLLRIGTAIVTMNEKGIQRLK